MWSGSELNLSQPFNGCELELGESMPRATAETKTRLETQTHTVSIHLSPVGGKKRKTHTHRVKIHWQGAAGQWPERGMTAQQTRSRSQRGLLGNRTSLMRCFIFYIKGLCASLCYSTLLKHVVRYQIKQVFWLSCYYILHWTMQLFPDGIFKRFTMKMSWRQAAVDESVSRMWVL